MLLLLFLFPFLLVTGMWEEKLPSDEVMINEGRSTIDIVTNHEAIAGEGDDSDEDDS